MHNNEDKWELVNDLIANTFTLALMYSFLYLVPFDDFLN